MCVYIRHVMHMLQIPEVIWFMPCLVPRSSSRGMQYLRLLSAVRTLLRRLPSIQRPKNHNYEGSYEFGCIILFRRLTIINTNNQQ